MDGEVVDGAAVGRQGIKIELRGDDGKVIEARLFGTEENAMAWALGQTAIHDVALMVDGREVWAGG